MLLQSEHRESRESSPHSFAVSVFPTPSLFHSLRTRPFSHPLHSPTLIHSSKKSIRANPTIQRPYSLFRETPGWRGLSTSKLHTLQRSRPLCTCLYMQESPQTLSNQTTAHSFVHEGGWGYPTRHPVYPELRGACSHTHEHVQPHLFHAFTSQFSVNPGVGRVSSGCYSRELVGVRWAALP